MNFFETRRERLMWLTVGVLLVVCVAVWFAVAAATPRGELTFAVLDVGQGDAIFIESPTGVQVVIDGGPNSSILRELPKVMPYGDRTIDAVIATHPDADHIAGLIDVLERYRVKNFIDPRIPKSTATAQALESKIEALQIPHHVARRGMTLDLGGGAELQILFPVGDVSHLSSSKTNEGGVVARLVYGESEVLLTADIPAKVEQTLVNLSGDKLQSDILKVGHHGSKTSTSEALLNAVDPEVAIISVGANNRYGHPTEEVLSRLNAHHVTVLRTDEKSTIRCVSNGALFRCN